MMHNNGAFSFNIFVKQVPDDSGNDFSFDAQICYPEFFMYILKIVIYQYSVCMYTYTWYFNSLKI